MISEADLVSNFIDDLNAEQGLATRTVDGPLLVLAGAGTGKTKVLVSRIAHIIFAEYALPEQILALTFTNKAANEMKERVNRLVTVDAAKMWLGTFHSIGLRILRMYHSFCDLRDNFAIADESDKFKIIKQINTEFSVDDKRYPVKLVAALISSLKERLIDHRDHSNLCTEKYYDLDIAKIYSVYQMRLISYNMADFDDLIFRTVQILENHEAVLQELQRRFRYILVDEYQDTSASQHRLLSLLSSVANNICCVGDEDQSIYSWRGAQVANIMNFKKNFPDALIVRLESNYRSTAHILHIASTLIAGNKARYGKVLRSTGAVGERVRIVGANNGNTEGRKMVETIRSYVDSGKVSYSGIAILVRTALQMRAIEEAMIAYHVPYRIVDSVRFYDRKEIKDIIAYLRLIYNFSDYIAFSRVANVPKRGVGDKTIELIRQESQSRDGDVIRTLEDMLTTTALGPKVRVEIDVLVRNLKSWQGHLKDRTYSLSELSEIIVQQSGYLDMLHADPEDDAATRRENLRELYGILTSFEDIDTFFEHVALFGGKDFGAQGERPMVSLMTMHAAKGLEFDMVLLPGWDEGIFPSYRALDDNGEAALEEERRLAYVAITRARKYLSIFHANSRFIYGKWQVYIKSCFIKELLLSADETSYIYSDDSEHHEFAYNHGYNRNHMRANIVNTVEKTHTSIKLIERGAASHKIDAHQNVSAHMDDFDSKIGDTVRHERFGEGRIVSFMGHFVEVKFSDQSKKLIQKNFLKKA